jgi:Zn-dependent peptidase ImmA (M78 family)
MVLGRLVEVRMVTTEEMRDVVADHDGAKGAWDADTRTIYLLKSLSPAARNRTFWHEVQHMLVDFFDP